jgi:hypothetical protein
VVITFERDGSPVATCTKSFWWDATAWPEPAEIVLTGAEQIPSADIKNENLSSTVNTGGRLRRCPEHSEFTLDREHYGRPTATLTPASPGFFNPSVIAN